MRKKKEYKNISILPLLKTNFNRKGIIIYNLKRIFGLSIFSILKVLRVCKVTKFSKNIEIFNDKKFNYLLNNLILRNFLVDSKLSRFVSLNRKKNIELKNYKALCYRLSGQKNK